MASYRDVAAVLNIAEAHKLSAAAQLAFDLNWVTRSVLYRQYVEEILRPMASSVAWSTDEALRVVDRIVAGQSPEKGLRNVNFSLEECGQSVGIPNKSKGKELCTALFKLKLFRRMGETFRWTMKNQTVVDYFLARWINRQVARGDKADCSSIKKSRSIFESSEVSSFLIGMRHARQCVPEIITVLCSSGADVEFTIDLIDQGLPTGKIRTKVLERTPSPEGENTKRCVDIVYRNLKESAEAP